ncbi:hypothetical protein ACYVVU_10660 [Arenicellales bacterium IMCC55707]
MTLLIRLLSVLVISTSLFVAGCSSGGSSAGFDKEDTDGDGIADIYDPDIDGDGIPNGQDPDIDGDGIPNDQDPDMDGDGKPNGKDPDPENNDPNYCDRIQVFGLNDEQKTGTEIELTWEFFNSKVGILGACTMKDGVKAGLAQITASAVGATDEKSGETNPLDEYPEVTIQIPHTCVQGATVEVTYDFTEFATLIKADPNAPGWTVKQPHKADPEECDTDGDGFPDFGPAQCPTGATGTYPSCSCPDGEGYDVSSNICEPSCEKIWLKFNDTQLYIEKLSDKSGFGECTLSKEQRELDLGVSWQAFVQWTTDDGPPPNFDPYPSTKVLLAGKYEDFPLSYSPCEGIDLSKYEDPGHPAGVVDILQINYDFVPELNQKAEAAGLTVEHPPGPNINYRGIDRNGVSNCGIRKGDRLPLGSSASAVASSNDTDNDGIPNDADPDVDGDGIPNTSDNDIDGDGIWNKDDPDIDGDGKTNGIDPDADGDGNPDAEDDTPGGPQ